MTALQHDHVAILCGGVAITPFLTLIPCILHAISERLRKGEELITKKMVLYWSCREAGLCDYVLDNYLKGMKLAADAMGFDFEIIVHRTGKKTRRATLDPIKCCRHIKLATNIMNLEDGSGPLDFKANGNLENNTSPLDSTFVAHDLSIEVDEVIDIDEQNDAEEEKRRSSSSSSSSGDSDRELPTNEDPQTKNSTSKAEISKGDKATNADPSFTPKKDHLMELHHFMPAKHSRVLENLPCFLALGGSMWIFFYIIFYFYRSYEVRAHEGADRLWPVFVCILVSIGLSVFFEGCPLMAKLLKKDGSVNPEPCKCRPEYLPVDDENGSAVVIDYRQGRANMCEIFEFADKAECPAIFMCGPPAMTKLVREKARQENSVFGLTRFVIYEDPFEM